MKWICTDACFLICIIVELGILIISVMSLHILLSPWKRCSDVCTPCLTKLNEIKPEVKTQRDMVVRRWYERTSCDSSVCFKGFSFIWNMMGSGSATLWAGTQHPYELQLCLTCFCGNGLMFSIWKKCGCLTVLQRNVGHRVPPTQGAHSSVSYAWAGSALYWEGPEHMK